MHPRAASATPQPNKAQPGSEKVSAFPAALRDNYPQGGHAWITRPCRGKRPRPRAFARGQSVMTFARERKFAPFRQAGGIHDRGHSIHQQPQLWLMVPAWLAAVPDGRTRLRGSNVGARRSIVARRTAAALAIVPGAVPDA